MVEIFISLGVAYLFLTAWKAKESLYCQECDTNSIKTLGWGLVVTLGCLQIKMMLCLIFPWRRVIIGVCVCKERLLNPWLMWEFMLEGWGHAWAAVSVYKTDPHSCVKPQTSPAALRYGAFSTSSLLEILSLKVEFTLQKPGRPANSHVDALTHTTKVGLAQKHTFSLSQGRLYKVLKVSRWS